MQKNKKQFYITELHLGDDGLESYTDCSGPFTLVKARRIMEKIFMEHLQTQMVTLVGLAVAVALVKVLLQDQEVQVIHPL